MCLDPTQCMVYTGMVTQIRKDRKAGALTPESSAACCGPAITDVLAPRFFRALCDPSRIALVIRLAQCGRPCTVSELAECCPTDLSVVSRHLALLRDAGVLTARRRGKEVYYSVPYEGLAGTLRAMADAIEGCCQTAVPNPKEPNS